MLAQKKLTINSISINFLLTYIMDAHRCDNDNIACVRCECPICHEKYMEKPMELQCGHSFCGTCITTWIEQFDDRCPICRVGAKCMRSLDGTTVPVPELTTTTRARYVLKSKGSHPHTWMNN